MISDPERTERSRRYTIGTWALHALKVFEMVHPSTIPFQIVAAYMGDRVITSVQRHALSELSERMDKAASELGTDCGAVVGARHALMAVKLLLDDNVNRAEIVRESDRAHQALVESIGTGGKRDQVD